MAKMAARQAWSSGSCWATNLCVLLLAISTVPAIAQDDPPPEVIQAAVIRDWPPYYVIGPDGAPAGFAIDLFDEVAGRAGFEVRYRVYPTFPLAVAALSDGEVDVIPNYGVIEGRDVLFTQPIDTFPVAFFARAATSAPSDFNQFTGKVAVVKGNVGSTIAATYESLDVETYESVREALFRLISGNVDGLIYPAPVVWALAREADVEDRLQVIEPRLAEVKRAIGVSRERPELVDRFDLVLESFLISREYEAIRKRWLVPPPSFWTIRRVAIFASILLLIASSGLIAWRILEQRRAAQILRRSEEKYRTLFESIHDAIVVCAPDRTIVDINPSFERLFGYRADEVRGRTTLFLYETEDGFERFGERLIEMKNDANILSTLRYRTKDGLTFFGETNTFHRYDDAGNKVGYVGIVRDVTEQLETRQELEKKKDDLERLSSELIGAQETERKRIARELHDSLGGMFTTLSFDVAWLKERVDDQLVIERLVAMAARIDESVREIRELARQLRPKVIDDFGLSSALEDLTTDFSERGGIKVELSVHPKDPKVRPEIDIMLYRIIQEALTNVARHSGATHVEVRVRFHEGQFSAEIRDNGRGIDPDLVDATSSLGILSMRERAEMIGATLRIESYAGKGTILRVSGKLEGRKASGQTSDVRA